MSERVEVGFTLQPDDEFLDRTESLLAEVDYAEIAPETTWYVEAGHRRENGFHRRFLTLGDRHDLSFVAHGVGYSVGDAGGEARRKRWREWVAADHATFGFRWWTDHLCATALDQDAITLPIALPMTEAVATRVRRRLDEMRSVVPVVGVETTVAYFTLGDPMDEPAWLNTTLGRPGQHLLLDVHNVFTSAQNFGFDADEWIARLELDHVVEIHVSGGAPSDPAWLPSGRVMRLDAHSSAVPEPVFELLERWAPRCRHLRGITLERMEGTVTSDQHVEELRGELARVRSLAQSLHTKSASAAPPPPTPTSTVVDSDPSERALAGLSRAADPVAHLRAAGLDPNDEDGVRLAALLTTRLRFERLLRGSGHVERWFEEDPADFTEVFRAYHAASPLRAFFPADEAREFDAWLRKHDAP